MGVLRFLLEKEFRQFLRDPFLPRMTIIFPVMVMLIMPWVTTMDIRHVRVAVIDNDRSQASRRIITKIGASDYFTLLDVSSDARDAVRSIEELNADAVLEIPDRFERSLTEGTLRRVSITSNGVNALKGSIGGQYLSRVVAETFAELQRDAGQVSPPDTLTIQNRYNPTLDYRRFMIPALVTMLLVILCGFMPALNLVNEKETGTIEQINVTPVGKLTFTLGKLIPFWLIGLVVLTISIGVAWAIYSLTPSGSIAAIYLASALLILVMSGIGVTVANYSSTMQQAMFVMFFIVMIFMLMSGLFTPIESMPDWAQTITWGIPPRYFIEVMRSAYLKGTGFTELWPQYAALAGFAVGINLWAAISYRKQA